MFLYTIFFKQQVFQGKLHPLNTFIKIYIYKYLYEIRSRDHAKRVESKRRNLQTTKRGFCGFFFLHTQKSYRTQKNLCTQLHDE